MYRLPRNSYEFNTDPNKGIDYILAAIRGIQSSNVSQIIAGTNVTISPVSGTGAVTINASGGTIPTLDQVTTAGNTTTNAINVGTITSVGSAQSTIEVGGKQFQFKDGGGLDAILSTNYNNFRIKGNNNAGLYINLSGHVSATANMAVGNTYINASAPPARLTVKGSGTNSSTNSLLVENSSAIASLVVNDAGNVLIGTTTDAGYKLNVNGNQLVTSLGTDTGSDVFHLKNSNGRTIFQVTDADRGYFKLGYNNPVFYFGTNPSFYTINTLVMRLSAAEIATYYDKGFVIYTGSSAAHWNAKYLNSTILLGYDSVLDSSAQVQFDSTNKGFLRQRMTTAQRDAITSPATGLSIYNTSTNTNDHYDGTNWVSPLYTTPTLDAVTTAGNSTTNTINIDTSSAVGLSILRSGTQRIVSDSSGSNGGFILTGSLGNKFSVGAVDNDFRIYDGSYLGNGDLRFSITSGGNVLIGTTTDNGYKLQVNGDATINGVRVGLGGGSVASNTVVGFQAAYDNTSGSGITAVGYQALRLNLTGVNNTAVGYWSLKANTTGGSNSSFGMFALSSNVAGSSNTAIGESALKNNTASNNVAVGREAAYSTTSASGITAVGYQAMKNCVATEATNSAFGYQALLNLTTGTRNTAVGSSALSSITTGSYNTAVGRSALQNNASSSNTAVGESAMSSATGSGNTAIGRVAMTNSTGSNNTAVGYSSLSNVQSLYNTAVGFDSLRVLTTGSENSAVGANSLTNLTTGSTNTAFGYRSQHINQTGSGNTAYGRYSLYQNISGGSNVAVGQGTLYNNLASSNTAVGHEAAYSNTSGVGVTAIGYIALRNSTGDSNTALGYRAGYNNTTGTNNIFIGYQTDGVSATDSNRTFIGNASTTSTWVGGNLLVGTTTDAGYKLDVNGSVKFGTGLYWDNTNNRLGIGTPNPSRSLQVVGIIKATSLIVDGVSSEGSTISLGGASVRTYTNSSNPDGYVHYITTSGSGQDRTSGVYGSYSTTHTFAPTSGTSIYNGLNIGISINQTGGANGVTRGVYINPTLTSAFDYRAIETTAGNVIFNGGNVGIGTTAPSSKLQLGEDASTLGSNVFTMYRGGSTGQYTTIENQGGTVYKSYGVGGHVFYHDPAQEAMRVAATTGNLLVGTSTDAGYRLDVNGTARVVDEMRINGTTNAHFFINRSATNRQAHIEFLTAGSLNWSMGTVDTGDFSGAIGNEFFIGTAVNNPRFLITNGGNVGIGTTAPEGPLHVKYSSSTVPGITIENDGVGFNAGSMTLRSGTTGGTNMSVTVGGGMYWYNLDTFSNTLSLPSTGNLIVGGAVDAGYRLDVQGGDARFSQNVEAATYSVAGNAGWSGIVNFPSNPPGQQNLEYLHGILINVF